MLKKVTLLVVLLVSGRAYASTIGPWNLEPLFHTPQWEETETASKPGMKGVLYSSISYNDNPVRVFAYYGVPEGETPVGGWPAVVCVHGGGGTAFDGWVEKWNDHGYAAISMDLEGHYPIRESAERSSSRLPTEHPGPTRVGVFHDFEKPIEQQWYYHAVAQVVLAHSLIRSFPEVNPTKIGLTGISWGGTLTSTVMGVDHRFRFAIPVYGCGFLPDSDGHQGQTIRPGLHTEVVNQYCDGSAYFQNVTIPTLWLNGTNDKHFTLPSTQVSSQAVRGPVTLRYQLEMPHGHEPGWRPEEIYAFADSVVRDAVPLVQFDRPRIEGDQACVEFHSESKVAKVELLVTTDITAWPNRRWQAVPATVTGSTITATIPGDAVALYFNATDERGLMTSSEFVLLEQAETPERSVIDYEAFLGQHDMEWDRVPHRWEVAPYTGNGNVGFLFYQARGETKNVISIYAGRHDYYDHRLPYEGHEMLWIYRSRLPLGHFNLTSKGAIKAVDLRLDLWNAELTGTITTELGAYEVRGLSHSVHDVICFETVATGDESIAVTWHPDEPMPPVRATLDRGGGPRGGSWDRMRTAPMPMPPSPTWSEVDGMTFCFQPLYDHRGETTTGWEVTGKADGKQILCASIHHSFPERNSLDTVKQNLHKARVMLANGSFFPTHQQWWHNYYPLSFVTINDPEKEAFYWIQMYKFASATRGSGPIMDLMGPWYHKTFWPMVWGDLNVELQYWTHLTANRLGVGSSLPNCLDKYASNLYKNVPSHWTDSAGLATLFPQDLDAHGGSGVPDMLCWILHDYWLHCEFAGDRERMRDGLFPILRRTGNSYLNYLRDNPVKTDDGKVHVKRSWSPEYPGGRGQDINFTIGLMRWCFRTLLEIDKEHGLNAPLASQWKDLLDNLVEFQIDEDGLRIGKDIPFDKPHRHYSHLLPFYPLAVLKPESDEGKELLRTSLDHWLDVTFHRENPTQAMAVTGYTATGAASMYAMLGDAEQAYHYLDFFIKHNRVSPTTMYAEGNPVIESPLSFATCIHDMLLQSWGGTIRVFPGTPRKWADVAFHQLRTQGAFLVSAKKKGGVTEFVTVESLIGSPCVVRTDIPRPIIALNGVVAQADQVRKTEDGAYRVTLGQGDTVTFCRLALDEADLGIHPIFVDRDNRNLFGYSRKTERLPGHQHYSKQ